MAERILILETSQRVGRVALSDGSQLLAERSLDESRRHARDLAPAVRDLLAAHGWTARSLELVLVSRGPGSYTGLRVGVMSAKALAYATGCALVAVDTFAALARQAPVGAATVDVIADAQQERVYCQRFGQAGDGWQAQTLLTIRPVAEWLADLRAESCVLGPGLERFGKLLPAAVVVAPAEAWLPQAESVLAVGLERWRRGERDDVFAVEPLYLRPSSAEEQWTRLGR